MRSTARCASPPALPERLGLALVERLRAGERPGIAVALAAAAPETAEAELALLARLAPPRDRRRGTGAGRPAPLAPGVALASRLAAAA